MKLRFLARMHVAMGFAALTSLVTVSLGQGGDDPDTCTPIVLGATAFGTTVGYSNDSSVQCSCSFSHAPDVYYCYTPTTTHDLTVELCQSSFNTSTYVYDANLELITDLNGRRSCNDDGCSSAGGVRFASILHCVPVSAGEQYFVVVDGGRSTEAGEYQITLHDTEVFLGDPNACAELPPCIFDPCDPAYTPEGEPCNEGENDCFNGGCNCTSGDPLLAFSPIACGETICGSAYFDGFIRDTDWYRYEVETSARLTLDVVAEFRCVAGRINNGGFEDCAGLFSFAECAYGQRGCEALHIESGELGPGGYWYFIATDFTEVVLCSVPQEEPGTDYIATLSCELPLPPCPWDLNGNLEVDFQDLLQLLASWGPCPGT